jgi:hypothetical protein
VSPGGIQGAALGYEIRCFVFGVKGSRLRD